MNLSALVAQYRKDFHGQTKFPLPFPPYIDQWPRYPAWIITFFAKKNPSITPEFLVFLGLLARLLAALLITITPPNYFTLAAWLLLIGIILDNADGQLARYTNQVRSLGALYDLATDFTTNVVMFIAIGITINQTAEYQTSLIVLLTLLSLASHFLSISAWTYIFWRSNQAPGSLAELSTKFHSLPHNDNLQENNYQKKFRLFRAYFDMTWVLSGKIILAVPIWKDSTRFPLLNYFFSFGAIGSHLTILTLFLFFKWPLIWFLIYQIAYFCLMLPLIKLNEYKKPNS